MAFMFRGFEFLIKHHPMLTQATNTGLLMGTGDVIAQLIEHSKEPLGEYDATRTTRYFGKMSEEG